MNLGYFLKIISRRIAGSNGMKRFTKSPGVMTVAQVFLTCGHSEVTDSVLGVF